MVDLIYNFIYQILIANSTIAGGEELAILLTWAIIVGIVFVLIRLVVWAFQLFRPRRHLRR